MLNESILAALLQASISQVKPVNQQQTLVGGLVVFLCLFLLFRERWFLENTKKGKLLISWFGQQFAPNVLRALIFIGILFGSLLAAGIIRPIQWR